MGRSYGILFSEFDQEVEEFDIKIVQLETIRRELEQTFSYERFQFDIIKVVSHHEDNAYPEIGVYSVRGDITDGEYTAMEAIITARSANNFEGSVPVAVSEGLSWEVIKTHGSYPQRP